MLSDVPLLKPVLELLLTLRSIRVSLACKIHLLSFLLEDQIPGKRIGSYVMKKLCSFAIMSIMAFCEASSSMYSFTGLSR